MKKSASALRSSITASASMKMLRKNKSGKQKLETAWKLYLN